MNEQAFYDQLIKDFNLRDLDGADREDMLFEITKTIHKQFLLDVYEVVGEEQFGAIQASASMGEEFYYTTIKHLVPDYEAMFFKAKEKVCGAFAKA